MEAYLEVTVGKSCTIMSCITNVLIEEIDDTISLHAENGFMIILKKDDIIEQICSEDHHEYKMAGELNIVIDFYD